MSKKKTSFIWLYFEDEGGKKAKCKFCKTTLSFSGGCNGNLNRHLKSKHSLTSMNFEAHMPISTGEIKMEEPLEEQPASSTQITTVTQQQQITKQSFDKTFLKPVNKEKFNRQVLQMISKGYHSFRLVEEPAFQELINEMSDYNYNPPSRKFLYNLVPIIRMKILADIKVKLQSASDVSLSIDTWITRENASYASVTAHYINADTVLTSHLLACAEYENNLTSEKSLYNFLKEVISDFKINNKITAIVSEHTPNIVAAVCQGDWLHVCCFAHILNSLVLTATGEIIRTLDKVRKIVKHFRENLPDLKELQNAQTLMSIPEIKLKQDDPIRWTSTYEMLQRIKQMQDALISILSLTSIHLMMSFEDWEIIGETLYILEPFYEVIAEISKETHISLSKVTVLCNLLESFIHNCCPLNEQVIAMLANLQRDFAAKFGNLEKEYLYAESTILDPRFKSRGFKNDEIYEQSLRTFRTKICSIKLPIIKQESEVKATTKVSEYKSIWEAYDLEFHKTMIRHNNTSNSELEKYLNEEYLDRKYDPILWWSARKNIYPTLYLWAVKRLCIVATSVPCERIFSLAGQLITQRRAILERSEVEGIVFLHNNM